MEHRNADTLAALNKTEKALKDKREKEYISLELCEQVRDGALGGGAAGAGGASGCLPVRGQGRPPARVPREDGAV